MVADFVSADYGFLQSHNGNESAHVKFKSGKNRDGYFTNDDILKQAEKAMVILKQDYPHEDHFLIYDNATTHLKQANDAISACKMPKNTPKVGSNWGVEVSAKGPDGKNIYGPDGKPLKTKVRMGYGTFADGSPQDFYFPEGHPRAGVFKGMSNILEEQAYGDVSKFRAECPRFKCDPGANRCCCWRMLYNEPDFIEGKSLLEGLCHASGFDVLFLPKFHCELNFIEMCWGHAKRTYCLYPPSSREDDLERNMLAALETLPIENMRRLVVVICLSTMILNQFRYVRRSRQFMDAYHRGLTGKQAAWAGKRYHGHRILSETLMADMEADDMS